ncbi:hypothetical protein [Chitinophaga jiangningensis]|uniref:hypothetical protein n=1 Tax=Chitinophaga jiangningensis TaxID=1419482 RepID=UPI00116078B1|nr:hypothetical protein [Chitinophaga jiangningensis]
MVFAARPFVIKNGFLSQIKTNRSYCREFIATVILFSRSQSLLGVNLKIVFGCHRRSEQSCAEKTIKPDRENIPGNGLLIRHNYVDKPLIYFHYNDLMFIDLEITGLSTNAVGRLLAFF